MHHVSHVRGRTRPLLPAAVLLLALCLLAAGAQALMVPMDDAALATGADEIVRGEIVDVHADWTADHTTIVTTASVTVKGRAKGAGPDTLTLTSPGGTVDGVTQWVEDQPVLAPGTEAFVFVKHGAKGEARVYGGPQGVVPVEQGRVHGNGKAKGGGVSADAYGQYIGALATGSATTPPASEPAPRAASGTVPVITNVSPSSASAGTGTTITITGTGFGTKASRESYADVGFFCRWDALRVMPIWASGYPYYNAKEDAIVSWSDTEIVVRVPVGATEDGFQRSAASSYVWVLTDANTASANVPFAVTFGYGGAKWAQLPVPYYINPDGLTPALITAIRNASETWNSAVADTEFRFEFAGFTTATYGNSSHHVIFMGPASNFPDDQGAYAVTGLALPGGEIDTAYTEFNPHYSWTGGDAGPGEVSIEHVALHELGHWLYLMDLYGYGNPGYPSDSSEIMFGLGGAQFENLNLRTLQPDDVAGIRWIYANGTPLPPVSPTVSTPQPYPGPHVVPTVLQAEDYDAGGEGVAYHDTEPANLGGAYRPNEGVDVETGNGITDVGWIRDGEWLTYTVNATVPQIAILRLRASNPDTDVKSFDVIVAGAFTGAVLVPPTGSFGSYTTVAGTEPFWLPAGATSVRVLYRGTGRVNLDYLEFVPATLPTTIITKVPTTAAPTPQPYPGPHVVPTVVQAEDYDAGGEGVAYHDFEPANLGGAYRPAEGVDIETGNGITDVGWVRSGEWLTYTVNATSPQNVMLRLHVSNPDAATKEIPILVNEEFLSTVWVPSTGSFGAFATIDSGPFPLPAGETAIRLVFEQIDRVDLDWLEFAPAVAAVPGSGFPTDTNGDGKYDDVNGNGRADFADVVLYFNQMAWIAANEPLRAFDYNGNGRIDFADVVWLFNHL